MAGYFFRYVVPKIGKNLAIPKLINGYFHDNFLKLVVKNQN